MSTVRQLESLNLSSSCPLNTESYENCFLLRSMFHAVNCDDCMDDIVLILIGLVHFFITHGHVMYAQTTIEKKGHKYVFS